MSADKECKCCDPRWAAVALGRWCLGLIFLFFGIGKLADVSAFAGFLRTQFEKTWLPPVLVGIFGHVLPFAETLLGALLVVGLFRNGALFAAGVLLLLLTFGQILLGQAQVVFFNTGYVFMTAALLFLAEHDGWVVYPRWRTRPVGPTDSPPA
jgi:thiosulfate dehydrogenase [quinone] large subunit